MRAGPPKKRLYTHTISLSMGEEHPLTLGAVVARAQVVLGGVLAVVDEWQRHLIHIGALVRQEAAVLATLCDRTAWIHGATNSSAAGWGGG